MEESEDDEEDACKYVKRYLIVSLSEREKERGKNEEGRERLRVKMKKERNVGECVSKCGNFRRIETWKVEGRNKR